MKFKLGMLAALAMVSAFAMAQRAPTVTYTVTGSAGNWDLDFTLQSNFLPGEGDFYFFGVKLDSGTNIVSSPVNYDPNTWPTWDNTDYGGSGTIYNNNWIDQVVATGPTPGNSLGGFVARCTDVNPPTSVQFFAFAANGTYTGNDFYNWEGNPGFEGVAVNGVPEPASLAVLGLGALMLVRRRKSN